MLRRSIPCVLLLGTGCTEFQTPAQEISRLSVNTMSALVEMLGKDDRCGFDSAEVKAAQHVEGEPGQGGVVTRTVENCELDVSRAEEKAPMIFGCNATGFVSGKVVVSAERKIFGLILDAEDPDDRVIPAGPEALSVEIKSAELTDFTVQGDTEEELLTIREGLISGTVGLKLARDKNGFCGAPTRHFGFQNINLSRAKVRFVNAEREFNAVIQGSSLNGVRGEYNDTSNVMQGEMAINNARVRIPLVAGDYSFDPSYDPAAFEQTFVCEKNTELAIPLSYECGGNGLPVDGGGGELLAENLSRLTVSGFAKIVSLLGKDTSCGFESTSVKERAISEGAIGSSGTITYTADQCALVLAPATVIDTDCTGAQTIGSGRVIVSAKKRVRGRLTGDVAGDPVVPLSDDAVSVEVTEMRFENFEVNESGKSILWNDGVLRGTVTPRLAIDDGDGVCSFPSAIARFENLAYAGANVVLSRGEERYELAVESSGLNATSGRWGDEENILRGAISVAGETYGLTNAALDPDYDAARFDSSWQCGTLRQPVSYDCNVNFNFADGASQLAVMVLGALAPVVNDDTSCGFESDAVKRSATTSGTLGRLGGSATLRLGPGGCRYDWPAITDVDTDCNGKKTTVRGSVTITGTKRLDGWLSGDLDQPIVPAGRDPAVFELEIEFRDFAIFDRDRNELIARSGRLRGTLRPRTAIAIDTEVCSIATPVVTFENVAWDNATLAMNKGMKRFELIVASSALHAQSGSKDGVENTLGGTIVVDGTSSTVPADPSQAGLDPNYDRATFDASYQSCNANLRVPAREEDCDLRPRLGKAAARALVLATGTMAGMIHRDANCGFSDSGVLEDPTDIFGGDGDYGYMDFATNNCQINRGANSLLSQDCLGRSTYAEGRITFNAREHVEGERDAFLWFNSIWPLNPNGVTMYLDQVVIDQLAVYARDPSATRLDKVIIHSGLLSGIVSPMTGAEQQDPSRYTVGTPVAAFEHLALTNGDVTLIDKDGKNFRVTISSSDLAAFNGAYNNDANRVGGSMVLEGLSMTLPSMPLDEAYDQAEFDQRYVCTSNLSATLPPNSTVGRTN